MTTLLIIVLVAALIAIIVAYTVEECKPGTHLSNLKTRHNETKHLLEEEIALKADAMDAARAMLREVISSQRISSDQDED